MAPRLDRLEEMRLALELGLRDYVEKNGFQEVVLGLSGGHRLRPDGGGRRRGARRRPGRLRLDALPLLLGGDTVGRAADCRGARDTRFLEIPIDPIVEAFSGALAEAFAGTESGVAEENVQARVRGTLLMALSNKFGWLLAATGNKSELSVGYATLYGDMAGGFAPLKDVFKTDVFRLARHLNERAGRELIPTSTIERAAERRATGGSARRGLAAALREARRRPRGLRRARPVPRGALAERLRRRDRRAGALARRSRRVQAAPGASRSEAAAEGIRPRPAGADHEPLGGQETEPGGAEPPGWQAAGSRAWRRRSSAGPRRTGRTCGCRPLFRPIAGRSEPRPRARCADASSAAARAGPRTLGPFAELVLAELLDRAAGHLDDREAEPVGHPHPKVSEPVRTADADGLQHHPQPDELTRRAIKSSPTGTNTPFLRTSTCLIRRLLKALLDPAADLHVIDGPHHRPGTDRSRRPRPRSGAPPRTRDRTRTRTCHGAGATRGHRSRRCP